MLHNRETGMKKSIRDDFSARVDSRRGRILVADDEEKNRRLLCDILEAEGHGVILVQDGQQALETAFAATPDVVLLDIMMPKMDGFEVCRRLKADPKTASIPVIIVTALVERSDRIKGVAAGADDFLVKPIDREELILRVRNSVYRKHLYDELANKYAELKTMAELRDSLTRMLDADTDTLALLLRRQAQGERTADGLSDRLGEDPQAGGINGAY